MIKNNKKIFLVKLCTILLLNLILINVIINYYFNIFLEKNKTNQYNTEFWSHRGIISDTLKENSIESFEVAFNKGLKGIETDVFWIDSLKKCVVMHDFDSEFHQKQFLYLEDILYRFKDSMNYWIDFKNLSLDNATNVNAYLEKIATASKTEKKMFVESGNGLALRKLNSKKINTLYWIQYNRTNFLKKYLKLLYTKTLILFSDFEGFTIAYSFMDSDFKHNFTGLPLYLFHGNFLLYTNEIKKNPFLKVCLVDKDYYY